MNWSADEVVETPPGPFTVTSTVPTDSAGLVAVICAAESHYKAARCDRAEVHRRGTAKFDPVIVTDVPPIASPAAGAMPVTAERPSSMPIFQCFADQPAVIGQRSQDALSRLAAVPFGYLGPFRRTKTSAHDGAPCC